MYFVIISAANIVMHVCVCLKIDIKQNIFHINFKACVKLKPKNLDSRYTS